MDLFSNYLLGDVKRRGLNLCLGPSTSRCTLVVEDIPISITIRVLLRGVNCLTYWGGSFAKGKVRKPIVAQWQVIQEGFERSTVLRRRRNVSGDHTYVARAGKIQKVVSLRLTTTMRG